MSANAHPDSGPLGHGAEPAPTLAREEPQRRFARTDLGLLLALAGPNVASTAAETIMSFVDFTIVSVLGAQAQAAAVEASPFEQYPVMPVEQAASDPGGQTGPADESA